MNKQELCQLLHYNLHCTSSSPLPPSLFFLPPHHLWFISAFPDSLSKSLFTHWGQKFVDKWMLPPYVTVQHLYPAAVTTNLWIHVCPADIELAALIDSLWWWDLAWVRVCVKIQTHTVSRKAQRKVKKQADKKTRKSTDKCDTTYWQRRGGVMGWYTKRGGDNKK